MINYGAPMMQEKAGIEAGNKEKVAKVVEQYTEHSKFRALEEEKMAKLAKQVKKFKKQSLKITDGELKIGEEEADKIYSDVISKASLAISDRRIIFHVDMDAFFAQVEILDQPKYLNIPMAVGAMSMLCTSNYAARKFGVRSAMPGFIAIKLCPELVILPPDMAKYKDKSNIIHEILGTFDPNVISAGIDEAYIDVSDRARKDTWMNDVESLVSQVKKEIFDTTKLTCSIGVSYSHLLAKICSDKNKPNGQFIMLQDSTETSKIKDFIFNQPVNRINGVGSVTAEYLKSLDVLTCGDIYKQRAKIFHMFGLRRASWLYYSSYGLNDDQDDEDDNVAKIIKDRTIGMERTIKPTHDKHILYSAIDKILHGVISLLESSNLVTQRITLIIKFDDFRKITRCRSLVDFTTDFKLIQNLVHSLLQSELAIPSNFHRRIRLLGVRVNKIPKPVASTDENLNNISLGKSSDNSTLDQFYSSSKPLKSQKLASPMVNCPICGKLITNDDKIINTHVDNCLTLEYIKNECK